MSAEDPTSREIEQQHNLDHTKKRQYLFEKPEESLYQGYEVQQLPGGKILVTPILKTEVPTKTE